MVDWKKLVKKMVPQELISMGDAFPPKLVKEPAYTVTRRDEIIQGIKEVLHYKGPKKRRTRLKPPVSSDKFKAYLQSINTQEDVIDIIIDVYDNVLNVMPFDFKNPPTQAVLSAFIIAQLAPHTAAITPLLTPASLDSYQEKYHDDLIFGNKTKDKKIEEMFPEDLVRTPFTSTPNRLLDIKNAVKKMIRHKAKKVIQIGSWKPVLPDEFEDYLKDINAMPTIWTIIKPIYMFIYTQDIDTQNCYQLFDVINTQLDSIATPLQGALTAANLAQHQVDYPDATMKGKGGKIGSLKKKYTPVEKIVDIKPLKKEYDGATKDYLIDLFHKLLRYENVSASKISGNPPVTRDEFYQYISDWNVLPDAVNIITEAYEKVLNGYDYQNPKSMKDIKDLIDNEINAIDNELQTYFTWFNIEKDQEEFPDELLIKKNEP